MKQAQRDYGYGRDNARRDLSRMKVMACESEVNRYLERHPGLTAREVVEAIIAHGPLRKDVEEALDMRAAGRGGK